jgi:MHS family proline/betaine transporter-like MFS transporter
VLSTPLFLVIRDAPVGFAIAAQAVFGLMLGVLVSTTIVAMTEIFPTQVRSSSAAMSYNISVALFGGTAPFIAVWLVNATGTAISPAYCLIATALVGLAGMLALPAAAPSAAPAQAGPEDGPPHQGAGLATQ